MDRQHNGRKYVKSQYTEVVIKNRKEKTDKQYHGQKKRKDRQTMPWSKEKKRQTNNTMVKRKEKTDKQYHGQKKRKDKKTKYTYNYIENYRFGNINNQRYIRKLRNGQQLLPN
jgi:hypothetical protein